MASTTIKVPRELRDRLAQLAAADGTTMAQVIEHTLDARDDAEFWAAVARTMGGSKSAPESRLDQALTDGLYADEDWSDTW